MELIPKEMGIGLQPSFIGELNIQKKQTGSSSGYVLQGPQTKPRLADGCFWFNLSEDHICDFYVCKIDVRNYFYL